MTTQGAKMKKCYKIEYDGVYYIDTLKGVMATLDSMDEEGEAYKVSLVYMSDVEFDNLPEFEGF